MKQQDIASVMVIGFVSVVLAIVFSNLLFSHTGSKQLTAEKVDVISPTFTQPSSKYFNSNSIDPTQIIKIGQDSNQTPFTSEGQ